MSLRARVKVPEAHPGKIDGRMGRNTNSAIRAIKKYLRSDNFPPCNYKEATFGDDIDDIRATLQNNTKFDANLWAVVFEIYQAELQVSLKQDAFDIFDIRENLKWVDSEKKAVGCGETWPIDARGKKNYRSQSNRRVEILFYDPDEIKDEIPCKEDKCAEDDCHIFKNMDRYNPKPIEEHLKWEYIPLDKEGYLCIGKLIIHTDIHVDEREECKFLLKSNTGYKQIKKSSLDNVGKGEWICFEFTNMPMNDNYTLVSQIEYEQEEILFEKLHFNSLSDASKKQQEDQIQPVPSSQSEV